MNGKRHEKRSYRDIGSRDRRCGERSEEMKRGAGKVGWSNNSGRK